MSDLLATEAKEAAEKYANQFASGEIGTEYWDVLRVTYLAGWSAKAAQDAAASERGEEPPIRPWYLDRDFPEIKASNAEPLVVYDSSAMRGKAGAQALCDEHNYTVEKWLSLLFELDKLRKHLTDRTKDVNEWMEITCRERDEKKELRAELEALKAERDRMKEALEMIKVQGYGLDPLDSEEMQARYWANLAITYRRIASEALRPADKKEQGE